MSNDANVVVVSGRLTRTPEVRTTPSGASVLDFHVASNSYRDGQQKTVFTKVTLWNKAAEWFSSRLVTGDHVLVEGKLGDDNFAGEDGKKTSGRLKIIDPRVTILSSSKQSTSDETSAPEVPEV